MKSIVLVFSMLLLAGCIPPPTATETANADYGPYPSDYENIVKAYYEARLKDPESARYKRIAPPQEYWYWRGAFQNPRYGYGWLVCATLNAKNSYGAYTGYDTDGLLIKHGLVIGFFADGVDSVRGEICN